ncbi:MAG: cytochrome c [Burkholderiaceae bacterium]
MSAAVALGLPALAASDAGKPGAAAVASVGSEDAPVFDDAFMSSEANIEAGGKLWKQCSHCHGAKAYPGKAPKLKPSNYTPEFVFKRVTKGFRKMPPWEAVFSREQRMQLVAYIKSRQFSP